jgi:hypothetical protein
MNGYLYWDEAAKICRRDSTDVLLVLSKAVGYDELNNNRIFGDIESYNINYRMISRTRWIFYQPFKEKELARFTFRDTAMFNGSLLLTEFEGLLYDFCYYSGSLSAKKMSPYWNDVERFYFSGPGMEMRTAARHFRNSQWYEAAAIWNTLSESPKKIVASRAAYNLALTYERDDVLEQAMLWIAYADSLYQDEKTISYKKILEERMKNTAKLDEQMAGK